MLSNRVGRFFAWVLSIVAVVILIAAVTGITSGLEINFDPMGMVMALMGALLIAFIHQLNDDLLNFEFLDNLVGKIIKRVLFYGALLVIFFFCYILFFENGGGRVPGELFEEICYCMMLPAPFAVSILCIWADGADWDKERLPFIAYFSLIPSFVLGLVIALIGPSFYIAGGVITIILGLAGIVLLTFKFGFIYSEGEGYNPFKKKAKKQKPEKSTSKMPTALYNKLCDELRAIANRYSGTKYLSYGIKLKISGYGMVYDDSATIYVDADFYLGSCSATSQWQIDSAGKEARGYQESAMEKMYNDLERSVRRLLTEYNYNVHFNYGVKPGHAETHDSSY